MEEKEKNAFLDVEKSFQAIEKNLETSLSKSIKEEVESAKGLIVEETKNLIDSEVKKINESTQKWQNTVEEFVNNTKSINQIVCKKSKLINDEASLKTLASVLNNKGQIDFAKEEFKAIRFSDATTTGDFTGAPDKYGEINVNKQPSSEILGDIDILPAVAKNDGDSAWDGYDESKLDLYQNNEMDAAQLTEVIKKNEIKIRMKTHSAKMIISSKVVTNPNELGTLDRNVASLNDRYDRKLAEQVFQDIIEAANKGDIEKFETSTADAPVSDTTREDLRLFPSKLKKNYSNTAIIYISRTFLNALFSKTVSDGHLPTEQFFYNANGISNLVTPEKAYIVKTFEHNQIGNYKSLANGTTDINTDYVPGGTSNDGKLLAFVADLKYCYKLIPSSLGVIGYDATIGNLLTGAVPAGKISYAAQGLVAKEAIKVLFAKAS